MARRQHVTVLFALAVVMLITFSYMLSHSSRSPLTGGGGITSIADMDLPPDLLTGDVIAPKLENATAKAELGHAAWKLLHTTMARFPEHPTKDESLALKTYISLFARLYPCGDCARHFQKVLAKYPPQTGSRNSAAGWACTVHNEVNKRLQKPLFDCKNIGDFYDCGCGDEDGKGKEGSKGKGDEVGGKANKALEDLKERGRVSVEKEGLTRGG